MYQQSALNESNEQSTTYLEKKSGELTENLSIIQTQIKSATDQLEIVRNQYEQASSKANGGRAGKLCTRCHQPGHYRACCSNPTCMDMNNCGASEKHPESKIEITELRKLIKDLQKKEAKASEELQSFKLAKERSVNSFFAVMRPRLRRQNEGRYVNRFSLDKDLILLKKIFKNKIPIDTSRDWEMPFLIECYRRGLPSVDSMWIVTHNCLPLHGTNWRIHIDLIEVLGKMCCCVVRHERIKCCFEFSCAAYPYFVRNLLFHLSNANLRKIFRDGLGWSSRTLRVSSNWSPKKYMLFVGWEVRMVKNCDRGLENAARDLR